MATPTTKTAMKMMMDLTKTKTRPIMLKQIRNYSAPLEMSIPPAKKKYVPTTGTYPKGFRVSGTHVGVKKSNTRFPDLALISSDIPGSAAAAVFTTNQFKAAPVQVSKETLEKTHGYGIQSVVINSGCANAVTGRAGLEDAVLMGKKVDECFADGDGDGNDGDAVNGTIVMSTGVIGQRYCFFPFFHSFILSFLSNKN